jgi:hypothetical protein
VKVVRERFGRRNQRCVAHSAWSTQRQDGHEIGAVGKPSSYAGKGVGRVTAIVDATARVRAIAIEALNLLDATASPTETRELGSPACLAHEMDDRYMGFAYRDELLPVMDELLELEAGRAGDATDRCRGLR